MEQDLSFFRNKRILVTGGGGYLGSKFAESLIASHAQVYLLDINFNDISENLILAYPYYIKLVCDLTNQANLEEAMCLCKPQLIFHFAALLNRERDFSLFNTLYNVNVKGTLHLLQSLKNIDYAGFFLSSSSEVYGNINPSPFHEDQLPMPVSPYSLTKLMAENLLSTFSKINNKPFTVLRIFNFHGPKMSGDFFISQLEYSLENDLAFKMTYGEQIRDFLEVNELITLIQRLASNSQSNGQIINVCSGVGESLLKIAHRIAGKLNKKHLLLVGSKPYRNNEIWEMVGDNKKMMAIINNIS